MPGLSLTLIQAMRLFGVSVDVAARIFRELADQGVVRLTADGRYVLDHDHP
jgi:ribosomal protein S25